MFGYKLMSVLGAETGTPITVDDLKPVFDAMTAQVSVSTIVGVLAGVVGLGIGIVFMWWVARKGTSTLFGAFRKGKMSV